MVTRTFSSGTRNSDYFAPNEVNNITFNGNVSVNNDVRGGNTTDTLTFAGQANIIKGVYGGGGNDVIVVSESASVGAGQAGNFNSGVFTNSVAGGTESVTIQGSAYVANVFGSAGRDTITIDGTNPFVAGDFVEVGYWVTGNGGNDVITITGTATVGLIEGDGGAAGVVPGNDQITIAAGSNVTVRGAIVGQGGQDQILVYGSGSTLSSTSQGFGGTFTVNGEVRGGTGDDTIEILESAVVTGTILGGAGSDRIEISSDSGNFTVAGGEAGVDNDTLDVSGLTALFGKPTTIVQNGEQGSVTFSNGQVINFSQIENLVICFTQGTQIDTISGRVLIEDLETGDLVLTADNGYQPVRWVGQRKLTGAELRANPNMYPIRIRRGAIGENMPERDLMVSPQHRILVKSKIASRMFESEEVLAAAKHLVALDGVDVATDVDEVTYLHFMCAQHEVVYAEGMASETLYTGAQALKTLSPEAQGEIFSLFPDLLEIDLEKASIPARQLIAGRRGRQLAQRHGANNKPLFNPSRVQDEQRVSA